MKVGIYDPYLDDLGGGEKYIGSIIQCLSKENKITIFWDEEKDVENLSDRFGLDFSKVKITSNIFSKDFGFFKRLRESKKYDCLIVLSDGSIPLVASKLFIHVQQPFRFLTRSPKSKLKIKRVSRFFCNSSFTKSYTDKAFGVKSEVLYPPVEIKAQNLQKENIILTVGKFRYRNVPLEDFKKLKVMIDSFKALVDKGLTGWKFVIVTGFSEHEEEFRKIEKEADDYPIEFLIDRSGIQLWDIYSRAKIYWHASGYGEDLVAHPEFAEHFGISTVEAMGAGAVPVVINAGGQREIVEDGKSGFLWDTLEELKDKTDKLISDNKLLEKMSEQSQKRAQIFAGDRFCKELKEIIK